MECWVTLGKFQIWIPNCGNEWQACILALQDVLTQYPNEDIGTIFIVKQHLKEDICISLETIIKLLELNQKYLEEKNEEVP